MKKILQLHSSILGEYSVSNTLSDYATELMKKEDEYQTQIIDLTSLPHLTSDVLNVFSSETPNNEDPNLQKSNELIEAVKTADVINIAVPMYNFHIPSQLKSFFDFIARAGITFKYTEQGPIGLLDSKPVYLFCSYGSSYGDSDLITMYLKRILDFLGLSETHFFYAEGLALFDGVNKEMIIEETKKDISKFLLNK